MTKIHSYGVHACSIESKEIRMAIHIVNKLGLLEKSSNAKSIPNTVSRGETDFLSTMVAM